MREHLLLSLDRKMEEFINSHYEQDWLIICVNGGQGEKGLPSLISVHRINDCMLFFTIITIQFRIVYNVAIDF